MKLFFVFSRRVLVAIFLSLVLFVLIFALFSGVMVDKNAVTHKNRIDFISNLGYKVDEETVSQKEIIIPSEFSDVYNNYNLIQQKAGYNLSDYRGERVICYSYEIKNLSSIKTLNLLVHNGVVIGGDVCSIGLNGEMLPLIKKKE